MNSISNLKKLKNRFSKTVRHRPQTSVLVFVKRTKKINKKNFNRVFLRKTIFNNYNNLQKN